MYAYTVETWMYALKFEKLDSRMTGLRARRGFGLRREPRTLYQE